MSRAQEIHRLKKIAPLAAVLAAGSGLAAASTAAAEPAKAYGVCTAKTSAVRVLWARHLK